MNKKLKIGLIIILALIITVGIILTIFLTNKNKKTNLLINISELTVTEKEESNKIKVYTQDDYDTFIKDYNNKKLPSVYVTEFLFDGADMYKTNDIEDFVEDGNDSQIEALKSTVININTLGNIELTGELKGGMIAVNTNKVDGEINLVLNNAKIDTDSKKIPVVYVYNKDRTYEKAKVTISSKEGTKNYLEGGKLKKVSLIAKEELSDYSSKYSNDASKWYNEYTNFYGVYTKKEVENILFATVTADNEDLKDGDPYYYYKASGAISSDIDLTFNGKGYLEVKSKNKEGIESKGNLSFTGSTGDYAITSEDDCLNTTTDDSEIKNAHNDLIIDVNSLSAIVSTEADEGDAIDSNGTLTINNGTIIALSKPGQDSGIDSEKGTYINGGTVIATGDMIDPISDSSKQKYVILSFAKQVEKDTLLAFLDDSEKLIFGYQTDREFTNLFYSSNNLEDRTYSLYQDGEITGTSASGVYLSGTYNKGTQLGYATSDIGGGMGGGPRGNMPNGEPPEMREKDSNNGNRPPEKPNGENGEPPEKPANENGEPKEKPSDDKMPEGNHQKRTENNENLNPTNKDFSIEGIANGFNGIGKYTK